MFDKNRWIPRQYAKPILEWQIKELERECDGRYMDYRRREYLQNEIKILKDFITKEL